MHEADDGDDDDDDVAKEPSSRFPFYDLGSGTKFQRIALNGDDEHQTISFDSLIQASKSMPKEGTGPQRRFEP